MATENSQTVDPTLSATELTRFFFALPEPLPLPDGWEALETVSNFADASSADDDPWVLLRLHQRNTDSSHIAITQAVVDLVAEQMGQTAPRPGQAQQLDPHGRVRRELTIVDAITTFDSPDEPPTSSPGRARASPPRADALNRCIHTVAEHVRAYRLASLSPYPPLTYERLSPTVIAFRAALPADLVGMITPNFLDDLDWDGPHLVMLEHFNAPDPVGQPIDDLLGQEMEHWRDELQRGSPFAVWRERRVDANGALHRRGDTIASVLAGQIASEVLLDSFLAILLWEERTEPEAGAELFEEGKTMARLAREFPPRLKGVWDTAGSGPVALWFEHSYRLRHRVVHGGYTPSWVEAEQALEVVAGLETHLFDRLAERRTDYPRSTLMTVGPPGLEQRNLWSGKIKQFYDGPAKAEPDWRESFSGWHDAFVQARMANL